MKRSLFLAMLVALCLAMTTAAPVGAAKPADEPIAAAEYMCVPPNLSEARVWLTGQGSKLLHIRGAQNTLTELFYVDDVWTEVGVNHIVANVNVEAATFEGPKWGTFHLDAGTYGEFSGRWSWGSSEEGRFSGRGTDGALIKGSLLSELPDGVPDPPAPVDCPVEPSYAEYYISHG